jgi:hypothetical protein
MIFSYIVLYLKCLYFDIWSNKSGEAEEQLQEHSFFATNFEDRKKLSSQRKTLLDTYNRVIREKIMSHQMCDKAAGTGLSFTHIKCTYNRSGQDGASIILSERRQNNKPRVTNQKKIIKHVCDFLARQWLCAVSVHVCVTCSIMK